MEIYLKRLHKEARLPTRAYPSSTGLDLYAFCLDMEGRTNSVLIPPGTVRRIRTGLLFGGFSSRWGESRALSASVCSRSGLAENGIFVANAPGIIDPEYRGEIYVLLFNGGHTSQYIRHGDRIAQLVVNVIIPVDLEEVQEVSQTARGDKGLGSSGI